MNVSDDPTNTEDYIMTMFNKVSKSFRFGDHDVTLTTGEIARQATGACLCQMDDTVVLATVVAKKETKPGQDFFPLTVDYIEKTYAAGKIPGGFFKREGRPSEKETLTSRLIDRPIRPLFPDGFFNEVQVIIHVLSADPAVDPDIPAMIGASAALAISGIPFRGPIGACRVGYINDQFVINPTNAELKNSRLDLVVAGTERAVLMVESEADVLPEKTMLEAVMTGHRAMQVCIQAINDLVAEAGKPAWDWQPAPKNEALVARIVELSDAGLKEAYSIRSEQARTEKLREVYAAVEAQLAADAEAAGTEPADMNEVHGILFELEAKLVRSNILNGEPRIDGRDTRTVRPIEIRQSVLPRTHVLPSSRVAKPRRSCLRRSARSRTNRSSTVSAKKRTTASCCTTTCPRSPRAKRAASAARSAAKSVTAALLSAPLRLCFDG